MNTYIHSHTWTHAHTCTRTHTHTCAYTHMYMHIHTCIMRICTVTVAIKGQHVYIHTTTTCNGFWHSYIIQPKFQGMMPIPIATIHIILTGSHRQRPILTGSYNSYYIHYLYTTSTVLTSPPSAVTSVQLPGNYQLMIFTMWLVHCRTWWAVKNWLYRFLGNVAEGLAIDQYIYQYMQLHNSTCVWVAWPIVSWKTSAYNGTTYMCILQSV